MENRNLAKREARSWLLRYLVEEVWEAFRLSECPAVQLDRRIVCLAEAILERKESIDGTDCVLQHFVGFVFHVSVLIERVRSGQLDEEVVGLIHAAARHWAKLQPPRIKRYQMPEPGYDLIDDLKMQAILSFLRCTGKRDAGNVLFDKLWPGDCSNAKRTKMQSVISAGHVLAKEPSALKRDIAAALAIVHSSLPDCLLLELAGSIRASGHSQSILCNPLSSRFSADSLIKSYWRKKLLLPSKSKSRHSLHEPCGTSAVPQSEADASDASLPQPGRLAVRLQRPLTPTEQQAHVDSEHTHPPRDADSQSCSSVDDRIAETSPSSPPPASSSRYVRLAAHRFADENTSDSEGSEGATTALICSSPLNSDHRDSHRRACPNSIRERTARTDTLALGDGAESETAGLLRNGVRRAAGHAAPAPASSLGSRHQRRRWSTQDEERLYVGVQKYGCSKWLLIKHRQGLLHKTTIQIKDKWRNLTANADRMRTLEASLGPLLNSTSRSLYGLRSVAS